MFYNHCIYRCIAINATRDTFPAIVKMFGSVCFAEWFDLCQLFGLVLILAPYDLPILAPFSGSWHQRWMFHVKEISQTLKTSFPQLVFRAVKENQGRFLATTIDILCRNLWWDCFLAVQTGSVQVAEGENQACKMLCCYESAPSSKAYDCWLRGSVAGRVSAQREQACAGHEQSSSAGDASFKPRWLSAATNIVPPTQISSLEQIGPR